MKLALRRKFYSVLYSAIVDTSDYEESCRITNLTIQLAKSGENLDFIKENHYILYNIFYKFMTSTDNVDEKKIAREMINYLSDLNFYYENY